MQDRRSDIGQDTVFHFCIFVFCHVYKRNRVQGVSRVGSTVFVERVIGITVVGDDDYFIAVGFGSLDRVFHAVVDSRYGLFDGTIDTGMANHITISIVHDDEVELLRIDSLNQLVFHFVSAHFRLQVVSGDFRARNQDTFFIFVRSFATTVKEESHMSVLLRLGDMKLCFPVFSQVFSQCVLDVFLVEQDMDPFERSIVRSHAVILQTRDRVHTLFRHILLGQHDSQFFCTVVAVVEKDHDITFFDRTIYCSVVDRFDKLVGHAFIIRFLHGLNHVGSLFALAFNQQVVGFFHAFPTFVAVHCIETTDDGCDLSGRLCTVGRQLFDKSFTALRVCVATVHEAVDESIVDSIFLGDIAKFEQVVERTVYATVGGQPHEMDIFAMFFGIREGRNDFRVLHDAIVGTSAVNLHQILVNDTSGPDIEVSDFRVTHLSVRQPNVFTACL